MPYRTLTLEEFAEYVGLGVAKVRQLAQRGKLPGEKVAGQWRFRLGPVSDWVQQQMAGLSRQRLRQLEEALGRAARVDRSSMVVTDLIGPEAISLCLPAKTKRSVLRELVHLAERTGMVYDPAGLREALYEREKLCSTAMPGGFAVPHPRRAMPYATAEPLICVSRTAGGIAFGGAEGELTDLFFLICSHDEKDHLHTLARLIRMLDQKTLEALRACEQEQQVLEILVRRERHVLRADER